MNGLIDHLEGIVQAKRKKQIRINGRQIMVTVEMAEMLLCVHDELQSCNQVWFVKLEARYMIDLAKRLYAMMGEKA